MREVVETKEDIENLYKNGTNVPYTTVDTKHFGYIGVLLSDKNTGKVQCHICGVWKETLAFHIFTFHKMRTSKYKKMFGFPRRFPLCSTEHSAKMAKAGLASSERLKKHRFKKGHKIKNKIKRLKNLKKTLYSESFNNKFNLCKDQILRRIGIVADKVGHFPTQTEMEEHDSACLAGLIRRYGSWNKFKGKHTQEDLRLRPKRTPDEILAKIRQWRTEHHRNPVKRDFINTNSKYPGVTTILKYFGSWSRALQMAGIIGKAKKEKNGMSK